MPWTLQRQQTQFIPCGMLRWKMFKKMQETTHDEAFRTKGPVLMQAGAAFLAFTYLSRVPAGSASTIRFLQSFLPSV